MFKIGIRKKFILSLLLAGVSPVFIASFLIYYSASSISHELLGEEFYRIANLTANNIQNSINKEVDEAKYLILSDRVREALKRSGAEQREDMVLSRYLERLLEWEGKYSHILITDREGALVAHAGQTSETSFKEAHWWKSSYNQGKGSIYVSDLYVDGKTRDFALDVAVPIEDDAGRIIGIFKKKLNTESISQVVHTVKFGDTGHAMLINSDGSSFICPLLFSLDHKVETAIMEELASIGEGWMTTRHDWHGWKNPLMGFAPVYFLYDVGGMEGRDKHWYILVLQDPKEIFLPFSHLLKKLAAIGLAVMVLLIVFGYFSVQKIVAPILLLKKDVDGIDSKYFMEEPREAFSLALSGTGEIPSGDEIEDLSNAFARMNRNLRLARERLITIERISSMGHFAAIAAHEIRNPLNAISNSARFLKNKLPGRGKEKNSIRIILEETEKLNQFIERILVFSRKPDLSLAKANIHETIEGVLKRYVDQGMLDGIQVEKRFDPDLPEPLADVNLIRQVLDNLIRNAIEAMNGKGRLEISTSRSSPAHSGMETGEGASFFRIDILDTGPGILSENRQRIFDPFFTAKAKGVGIGLAFSYFIIELHQGTILVKSEPGKGAVFSVLIPFSG